MFFSCFRPPHSAKSQAELTDIYNEEVAKVTRYERPLQGFDKKIGPLKHDGVLVETKSGKTYLVHKGKGFGIASDTVVVEMNKMPPNWDKLDSRNGLPGETVSDFVKRGGKNYNLLWDNCQDATKRNM
ncbi:predicted protein, partial [Nematostella vectensis]